MPFVRHTHFHRGTLGHDVFPLATAGPWHTLTESPDVWRAARPETRW
jgi:hypothetical protein